MSTLIYSTGGGKRKRYYKVKKNVDDGEVSGEVTRISCAEYDNASTNPGLGLVSPVVGDTVIIITKPYHAYQCQTGIVKNVLTRRTIHTRGHKVRLTTGEVGRTLKIIKNIIKK